MPTSQFVGKAKASTISHTDSLSWGSQNPGLTPRTWSNFAVGAAADDRRSFVVLSGSTNPVSSATIDGVSAEIHSTIVGQTGITIFSAEDPTGTTASATMNFSATLAQEFVSFALRATGVSILTPFDTYTSTGSFNAPGTTVNATINGRNGGIIVGAWRASGTGFSSSGLQRADVGTSHVFWQELTADGAHAFSVTMTAPSGVGFGWTGKLLSFI